MMSAKTGGVQTPLNRMKGESRLVIQREIILDSANSKS